MGLGTQASLFSKCPFGGESVWTGFNYCCSNQDAITTDLQTLVIYGVILKVVLLILVDLNLVVSAGLVGNDSNTGSGQTWRWIHLSEVQLEAEEISVQCHSHYTLFVFTLRPKGSDSLKSPPTLSLLDAIKTLNKKGPFLSFI